MQFRECRRSFGGVAVAASVVSSLQFRVPDPLPCKGRSSQFRAPQASSCKRRSSAFLAAAFVFRCRPEPIRAKRGWVRDLLLFPLSGIPASQSFRQYRRKPQEFFTRGAGGTPAPLSRSARVGPYLFLWFFTSSPESKSTPPQKSASTPARYPGPRHDPRKPDPKAQTAPTSIPPASVAAPPSIP